MHEYSVVQSLLDRAESEARGAGATSIHSLVVRIGDSSGVDARLLSIAYDTFREKTMCAKAELVIERVPVSWECPKCGAPIAVGGPLRCLPCNAPAKLAAGDEIVLARLELEVEDHV